MDEKNVDSWQLVYQKSKLYVEGIFIYCEIFILLLHSRRNSINCTIIRAFAATYFSCSGTILASSVMLNFVFITLKLRLPAFIIVMFLFAVATDMMKIYIFLIFFSFSFFLFSVSRKLQHVLGAKSVKTKMFLRCFSIFLFIGDRFGFSGD